MKIDIKPGTYVVAVSGGVDSVVLLHLLMQKGQRAESREQSKYKFVVAHYDHGIRDDSGQDREFVQSIAQKHGLPFVFDEGKLGNKTSEDTARQARYKFFKKVKEVACADAIVTAHHQDDLIETAIINLLRGTGRKGLTSLDNKNDVKRPLLNVSKKDIKKYAKKNKIKWREDSTNSDIKYRRNYIRAKIVTKLKAKQREAMVSLLDKTRATNEEIDLYVSKILQIIEMNNKINRSLFIELPHKIAKEVVADWLRSHEIRSFDKCLIDRITVAAKTYSAGKELDVNKQFKILITERSLALIRRDR